LRKRRTLTEKQCHGYPTFWQRLIVVSAILLSGEFLAAIVPSQTVHAEFNCVAGSGAPGGTSYGGQSGATGGVGGDCVLGGGYKSFAPGGFNQNNGNQGVSQENGGANIA
jgi:hypothetical protein